MKLRVTHRTTYTYTESVACSYNEVRLQPKSNNFQKLHSFDLAVDPDAHFSSHKDFYLNTVHYFEMPDAHDKLEIEGVATVETLDPHRDLEKLHGISFEDLSACRLMEECYDYFDSSHYVDIAPEIWHEAVDIKGDCDDVFETANRIMGHIFDTFTYDAKSTTVSTHMLEAFSQRKGVCQDLAHVMIGMCRSLKIPARYVSGYIYSTDDHHLRGDQASHAWCDIYLPELGWVGLDPTNKQPSNEQYVRVASGRDYKDVAPVKGTYRGNSEREMEIFVRIVAAG